MKITKIYFHHALPQASKASRRFQDRALRASEGWVIEPLPIPGAFAVRVTHPKYGTYEVSKVTHELVYESEKRILNDADFVRMNLPKEFWGVDIDGVTESAKPSIANYCANASNFLGQGLGFILSGPPGVGKSGAAAVLSKEVMCAGRSVFFVSVSDLREWVRNRLQYDRESTVMERCREVDFLVLDELREEDAKDTLLGGSDLGSLIASRAKWMRPTVVTTCLDPTGMKEKYAQVASVLPAKSPYLGVTGPNRRATAAADSRRQLIVKPTNT